MPGFNSISVPFVLLCSIPLAAALIYVPFVVVAYARFKLPGGYDQGAPRAAIDKLPPYAQRANWAHQNAFESFMIFSIAVLMAHVTNQQSALVAGAAIAYLIARLLYPLAYILNIPVLRSLMFGIGNIGIIILFVTSIRSTL